MSVDNFIDDAEKRQLLASYITVDDDNRFKRLLKDIDPHEARKITIEDTDLTMLHWASLKGSLVIQNWLIDKLDFPPDLDSNEHVWSPAHVAVIGGKDACLEALLMRKPEVINRPDKNGCTPIHLAAAHGRFHCLKILLKNTRVLPNINQPCSMMRWTPLMYATWHGRISCVELLVRNGAVTDLVDIEGRSPLHLCAVEGHLSLVKYFMEDGCYDINKCLSAADNNGLTALQVAELNKKTDICHFLLEKSRDPKTWEADEDLQFPGHIASLNNDLLNVKALIEKGNVGVNDTDHRGYTMLHKACIGGHIGIVKWLVHKGASIWVKTLGKETALDIAKRKKHIKVIEFLEREENRYEPFLKKDEQGGRVFIPLFSSLDSMSLSSMESQRFNELLDENKFDIINLEEQIIDYQKKLKIMENEFKEATLSETEPHVIEDYKKKIKSVNHEMLKLNYQLHVVKFNLYQLTMEPTPKEMEIATALADCEHQYEEILDQLSYEREIREQTEAELSRIRTQLLKLRDYILKNDISYELVSMVVSFDRYLIGKDTSEMLVDNPLISINRKCSIHFEIDPSNYISISNLIFYDKFKRIVESDIKKLSLKEFFNFIKLLVNPDKDNSQYQKRKKSKALKKKLGSPKGGVFITNK